MVNKKYDSKRDDDKDDKCGNVIKVRERLLEAQNADHDRRNVLRDCDHFIFDKDGQWEQSVALKMANRPRYTFDKVSPMIEAIMGEVEDMEFASRIDPAGSGANRETAKTFAGINRYVENISDAPNIYRNVTRRLIRRGFDCVRVCTDWAQDGDFDQDILIKQVNNSIDRVWFGAFEKQDASDAMEAWQLHVMSPEEYDKRWEDGSRIDLDLSREGGVGNDRSLDIYWYKRKQVTVGEYLYKKPYDVEKVLMSDGSVYEVDDKFELIIDELAMKGVTEVRRRKIQCHKVYSRFFDGRDWLSEPQELPFDSIPLVPAFGNFDVIEDKIMCSGIVEKLMDAQRIYNYARSREIEEGALAPREKLMMTKEQAKGHEKQLAKLNTSSDPVLFYNPDPKAGTVPFKLAGAQINPQLTQTAATTNQDMAEQAGIFSAQQAANPMYQSGEAIKQQISKGDIKTVRWLNNTALMIKQVTRLVISAIPVVYDSIRQLRIINDDGSDEVITVNQEIFDTQTGQMVTLNDTSVGRYDVVITTDRAFKSRRAEAAQRLTEMAAADQSLMLEAGDVIYDALDVPNADKIAERKREAMLKQGLIPESQMTDEEKQMMQAMAEQQAQNQQPDPNMVLAEAEMMKAQADMLEQENKAQQLQIEMMKIQLMADKNGIDFNRAMADIEKTRADTVQSLAKAEQISDQSVRDTVKDIAALTPQGLQN